MLAVQIKERKEMLTDKYNQLEKIGEFLDRIKDETYTHFNDKEVVFGKGVQTFYDKFINIEAKEERKKAYPEDIEDDGYKSASKKKIRVQDFRIETVEYHEDEGVLTHLQSKVAYLEDAIDVYQRTKDDVGSKFRYLVGDSEMNKHLEQLGYFDDVPEYIQGKLNRYVTENKLKYFRLTASQSQFSGRGYDVRVVLNGDVIPSISMYTNIDLQKESVMYPNYVGVFGEYSKSYMSEEKLDKKLQVFEDEFLQMETKYRDIHSRLEELTTTKIKSLVNMKRVKHLKKQKDMHLYDIQDKIYTYLDTKERVRVYIKRLTILEEHLTEILKEQDKVMTYLGELLNKEIVFMEKGFSN